MTVYLHREDLPEDLRFADSIAVDTETMGLQIERDALCLVQISSGDGHAHLIQMKRPDYTCPYLKAVLADPNITKIFHYARFDMAAIRYWLNVNCTPVYCTKIASRLARTYSSQHSLKCLVQEFADTDLCKAQQCSDWGANLSDNQQNYAASDVLYLHQIKKALDAILVREDRSQLAADCFDCLPTRVALDLQGWRNTDIFAHS